MNKVFILIFLILLLLIGINKIENFYINPNLFIKDFIKIDKHFRNCRKKYGVFTCVDSNPYKPTVPFIKYVPKKRNISYLTTKKVSDLMPHNFNFKK
tara:strand:+ start:472 stop:762 length:291 start_codon:yes stop_codon:yes gene_type:complete